MSGSQLVAYAEGKRMEADAGSDWSGYDLILDLYRLRYADKLALLRLREIADIFECFLNGEPSGHFRIDLEKDRIDSK